MTTDELVAELQRRAGPRAGARRDPGLAVGVRPGEVRQGVADAPPRRAARWRARSGSSTDHAAGARSPAVAAGGRAACGGAPCLTAQAAAARARAFPTLLIAAVFVPLAVGVRAAAAQRRRASASRTRARWRLIPPAVALVLWTGLRRARRRGARSSSTRARPSWAAQRPGLVARLRDLPTVLRLAAVVLVAVALARPQSSRAQRRHRAGRHRHRHRAGSVGIDAGDRPRPQPARGGQGGHPRLRAPAARPIASAWSCSGARPTPTSR